MLHGAKPLIVGETIETEGKIYRVEMVNYARAYCVPVRGGGKPINISPTSPARKPVENEGEQMSPAGVEIPVADKPIGKVKGKRIAKAARKATRKSNKLAASKTRVKADSKVKACACGCGDETKAFFMPGHDARFKGWLLKLERGEIVRTDLPKKAQKALAKFQWKKKGDGIVPTKNYKGETHKGYT